MDLTGADAVGRRLAERHAEAVEPDPADSLLNYAEVAHGGDWTLRSALVRLAQPHPVEVAAILAVMRRLDAALHHVAKVLVRHGTTCDRSLFDGPNGVDGADRVSGLVVGPPVDPYPDVRVADLGRLVAAGLPETDLLAGYEAIAPLDAQERLAVPLLGVASDFERLARRLADWAMVAPDDPPVAAIEGARASAQARLDERGVPEEAWTGPPPRGRRRSG